MQAVIGIGPYGGAYGTPQYIDIKADPPIRLQKIEIWSSANAPSSHINGLSFTYITASGKPTTIPQTWGSRQGVPNTVCTTRSKEIAEFVLYV